MVYDVVIAGAGPVGLFLAWAIDTDPAPDQATQSLTRWFGKPE